MEVPHLPVPRVEAELLVLDELAAQLDEIRSLQRTAGAEFRMIAPDPQRHSIASIGERELAIRFPVASRLAGACFYLNVDTCLDRRTALGMTTNFTKTE